MKWLLAVFPGANVNFCSVYISFLAPILIESKKITATEPRLLTKTILCPLNTQSQSSSGPNSLFELFFFCHDSIYLNFFVVSLHPLSFPLICHYLCSCRELLLMMHVWFLVSLPLSSSLIWHVSTSCQTSRGARSPNVTVWKVTGTVWGQYTRIVHIILSSVLRLHCLFGTAGLKVVIKWSDFQLPLLRVYFGTAISILVIFLKG